MRLPLSLLIATLALTLAAPAALASGRDVIKDCAEDGVIDGDYSEKEYEQAQDQLPSDIDEYTDCREAIRAGLTPGGKGRGGSPDGADPRLVTDSGAVAGSPEDIAALGAIEEASEDGDAPTLDIGGEAVTAGDPTGGGQLLGIAGTGNDVPASMIPVLLLLLVSGATGAYLLLRRRVPALARFDMKGARAALARLLRR
ncbi:MAG TPA: hypothetical protein VNT32_07210 [Thermoleophilaceae bacterium]|nr:hypothetical protein [Thermoleophilaceae bacterium]